MIKLFLPIFSEQNIQNKELANSAKLISYVSFIVLIYKFLTIDTNLYETNLYLHLIKGLGILLFICNTTLLFASTYQNLKYFIKIISIIILFQSLCWSSIFMIELHEYKNILNNNMLTTVLILMGTSSVISPFLCFWSIGGYLYSIFNINV